MHKAIKDTDGDTIANYVSNPTDKDIKYIFTTNINDKHNVSAKLSLPVFIDPKIVKNDEDVDLESYIGNDPNKNADNVNVDVKYTSFSDVGNNVTNGESFIFNVNKTNHTFDHIIYVNPQGNETHYEWVQIRNSVPGDWGYSKPSGAKFDSNSIKNFHIYELKNGDPDNPFDSPELNQSFYIDKDNVNDITSTFVSSDEPGENHIVIKDNKLSIYFPGEDENGTNSKKYIVVYTAKYDPQKNISTQACFDQKNFNSSNGKFTEVPYSWRNYNQTFDPSSSGQGDKTEEKGKFIEHDIFETVDENGKVLSKDKTEDHDATEGTSKETYSTNGHNDYVGKDGKAYEFSTTTDKKNNPGYDEKTHKTSGNYQPGKTVEITYVWVKTKKSTPTQPQTSTPQPNTPVTTPKQPTQVTNVSQPSQPTQPIQKVKKNKTKKTTKKTSKKRNHKRYNNNFGPKGERYRNNHYNNNFAPHGERFTNMNNNIRPNGEGVNNGSISNAGVKSGSLNGENNKALPQTGEEHSNLLTAFGLGLASLAAIFGIALNRKHRRN